MGTIFSSIPSFRDIQDLEEVFAKTLLRQSRGMIQSASMSNSRPYVTRSTHAPGIIQNQTPGQSQNPSQLESGVSLGISLTQTGLPPGTKADINDNRQQHQNQHRSHQHAGHGSKIDSFPAGKGPPVEAEKEITRLHRAYQPESWPPIDIIKKHLESRDKLPSTVIFARFQPAQKCSKKYVDIEYSTAGTSDDTIFECSDNLETLVPLREGLTKGDSVEDDIKYFLLILKTCMNNLNGHVWWNGFSIVNDPHPKNRLKVSGLETGPSQLLFELQNMKELEIHRTIFRTELRGKFDHEDDFRHIRIKGATAKQILVKQLRGNLVTVHIPEFSLESLAY